MTLHHGSRASALDLNHVLVNVNASVPSWVDLNPASVPVTPASAARQQAPVAPSAKPALGAASHQKAVLDAAASTLSATVPLSSPSTAVSFDTFAPVATFGRPDPFETDLSAGALSAGIQLDLPAGPGGLTPPLQLAYNSSGVSDQHNPQGAAPWVGEGWSLGLGAISWAEHNTQTVCQDSTCLQNPPPPQWEDSWQLSDAFGTAADLVPRDLNVVTYLEDSGRPITPSPLPWHTAPETRAKVISFVSPNPPSPPPGGWSPVPPCFRVFLPNGIMEEFGCTPDSLQFYRSTSVSTAGEIFLTNWLLDLITDPQGNQVHVTYQQDVEAGFNGQGYPRDIVPATVEWDSPGCHSQQTACTGGTWTPLMRVSFAATHSVAHVSGSSCAANVNLRCDDPGDLSGSGGVPAPLIQSTFVLNDAAVQVRSSGGAGWSTLRDYRFSYDQGPASTIAHDPESGTAESVAGKLLLTRLQEIGADGATALPARTFAYTPTPVTQYYEDSLGAPKPNDNTNCGPSWNTGQGAHPSPNCLLWSQSYDGNSFYLTTVSNGQGLSESFQWALARNNDHGVVSGSNADPFACNNSSVQSTYPCNMPDDESWSRAVLTQRQDSVVQLTQRGQGGTQTPTTVTSTWNYSYQVRTPLPATFGYDVMGRLTSGPLGTYTYGVPSHVHAATAIGSAWTSAYDAAGNMTCRAPSTSTTCAGTQQTGAQLGYNNEGELQSWRGDSVLPGGGFDLLGLSRYAYVDGDPENQTDPTGHINLSVGDDGSAVPIDNAFSGAYSWGSNPTPTYHRGLVRAYPASRSRIAPAPATGAQTPVVPKAPDTVQRTVQSNFDRLNSITTSQLLSSARDDWSSEDNDTATALAWLAGGGDPGQWCQSARCQSGMRSALQYVDNLWELLLAAVTANSLATDVAQATGGTVTARAKGYTVNIEYDKRGIVVRIMKQGGGRTNYYRMSVPGKAAYTVEGKASTDPDLTHIPIEDSSPQDIVDIVKSIKSQ